MMHIMRCTRPDVHNSVRDGARHMQGIPDNHYQVMLRVLDFVIATPERGLCLAPKREWDGKNPEFEFEINNNSDSDFSKYKDSSRSITGCVTYLNGALITYQSSTQKMVSFLATEVEIMQL